MLHRETGRGGRREKRCEIELRSPLSRGVAGRVQLSETEISQSPRTCRAPAARNYARCKSQPRVYGQRERERGSQPRRLASSFPPLLPLDATPPIDSRSLAVSRVAYQRATRENHLSSLLLLLLLLLLSLVYFASSIVRNEDKVSNDSPRSTRPEIIFHLNSPVSRLTRIGVIDS